MSVIAKLIVRGSSAFGPGVLVEMGCICENDLMTNWTSLKDDEDRMFTTASPSGDARLNLAVSPQFPQMNQGDDYYFVLTHKDEPGFTENPKGCFLTSKARISHVTDFGGTTKYVEICSENPQQYATLQRFGWKMSIDNPGAYNQLKPGTGGWLLSIFPCKSFTIRTAIDAAHGADDA
jgi:hypothetical protein